MKNVELWNSVILKILLPQSIDPSTFSHVNCFSQFYVLYFIIVNKFEKW